MEKFSVLIPSHKERERLYNLIETILTDKLKKFIKKIIVITPDQVKLPKSEKILLIKEEKRRGKYYAINLGLKKVDTQIVVMLSSDLKMTKNFLQYLIKDFDNPKVGMVVGRPMADKNSRIYSFAKIIWDLHHLLNLKAPKGTEICAFRKILTSIPKIITDEVFIENELRKVGYSIVYSPEAFGYTKIPYSLNYFLNQRVRIFYGHLEILKKYKFETSSLKLKNLVNCIISYLKSEKKISTAFFIFLLIQFEIFARLIGLIQFLTGKEYFMWKKE